MYLFYAGESGTTHDLKQQYFVLAGFCAHIVIQLFENKICGFVILNLKTITFCVVISFRESQISVNLSVVRSQSSGV